MQSATLLSVVLCALGACSAPVGPARPSPPIPDRDRDNIADQYDQCPDEPEDYDGHLDADGCPDFDNSPQLILDVEDRCPLFQECDPGFQDYDGCPDPDVRVFFPEGAQEPDEQALTRIQNLARELTAWNDVNRVKSVRLHSYIAAGESPDLAEIRAAIVRDLLIDRGVPQTMVAAEPVVTTETAPKGHVVPVLVACM